MTRSKRISSFVFLSLLIVVACQKSNNTSQTETISSDSLASNTSAGGHTENRFDLADLPEALTLRSTKLFADSAGTTEMLEIQPLSLFSLGKQRTSTLQEVTMRGGDSGFVPLADLAIPDRFLPATVIHSFEHDFVLMTVKEGALAPRSEQDEMFDSEKWHLLLYSPFQDSLLTVKLLVDDMELFCMANSKPTMHFFSTTARPLIESVKAQPHAATIMLRISYADGTSSSFELTLVEGADGYELTKVERRNL